MAPSWFDVHRSSSLSLLAPSQLAMVMVTFTKNSDSWWRNLGKRRAVHATCWCCYKNNIHNNPANRFCSRDPVTSPSPPQRMPLQRIDNNSPPAITHQSNRPLWPCLHAVVSDPRVGFLGLASTRHSMRLDTTAAGIDAATPRLPVQVGVILVKAVAGGMSQVVVLDQLIGVGVVTVAAALRLIAAFLVAVAVPILLAPVAWANRDGKFSVVVVEVVVVEVSCAKSRGHDAVRARVSNGTCSAYLGSNLPGEEDGGNCNGLHLDSWVILSVQRRVPDASGWMDEPS
ncbi:hypothetical protein CERZMDRAFT_84397 [Cercospora zeae-maydis SCOH1-5]|uniref:Uncharacterized protein n=1 Tax=Cercospora zeae-maydis SCOH1-5 TaxID=717836 RepID=A0A6A6FH23_9PEZI|nr:hypothetical protein CERZMDRAFT_84397 [Cercospora zeae-maydis SCOH1-5]